jgi:hypothetical protein
MQQRDRLQSAQCLLSGSLQTVTESANSVQSRRARCLPPLLAHSDNKVKGQDIPDKNLISRPEIPRVASGLLYSEATKDGMPCKQALSQPE